MFFASDNCPRTGAKLLATTVALSVFTTFGIGSASATATSAVPASTTSVQSAEFTVSDDAIVEVTDAAGTVVGYSVSPETRDQLDALNLALASQGQGAQKAAGTDDIFQVAQCAGAVAAFIALTVFPTARAAKVAVSLGRLVSKYGVQKTAQILTRTYKGSDINAEQIFLDFAKEAAGIGALSVCFNPI